MLPADDVDELCSWDLLLVCFRKSAMALLFAKTDSRMVRSSWSVWGEDSARRPGELQVCQNR
jgi:hypothetical protein